jgi:hypothetical protein
MAGLHAQHAVVAVTAHAIRPLDRAIKLKFRYFAGLAVRRDGDGKHLAGAECIYDEAISKD